MKMWPHENSRGLAGDVAHDVAVEALLRHLDRRARRLANLELEVAVVIGRDLDLRGYSLSVVTQVIVSGDTSHCQW